MQSPVNMQPWWERSLWMLLLWSAVAGLFWGFYG